MKSRYIVELEKVKCMACGGKGKINPGTPYFFGGPDKYDVCKYPFKLVVAAEACSIKKRIFCFIASFIEKNSFYIFDFSYEH